MFQSKSKFKKNHILEFHTFSPIDKHSDPLGDRSFLLISGAVDTLQTLNMQGFFYPGDFVCLEMDKS